jgi:hypothetical protein
MDVALQPARVKQSASFFLFLLLAKLPGFCLGQDQVPSSLAQVPTVQESKLVDGLLELLESKALPKSLDDTPSLDSSSTDSAPSSEHSASGATILEEDSAAGNSLQVVRTLMQTVSETMRRGAVGVETVQLQGNVIEHLDSLIEMLRQPESSSAMAEQEEESDQSQVELESETDADAQQSLAEENQTADGTRSQEEGIEKSEPSGNDQPQDSSEIGSEGGLPGQGGARPGLIAQPREPGELQRSVWGHLPEQVRSQLQSRMAEQFLPSYREQLEAYFRALLDQERME